jgi:peptidyl-Lys metalloendopeptidase
MFWKAARKGEDSKLGTLAHELSHFNDIGGTMDHGYGTGNARNFSRTPAVALSNADSFEYYIEKTPLK